MSSFQHSFLWYFFEMEKAPNFLLKVRFWNQDKHLFSFQAWGASNNNWDLKSAFGVVAHLVPTFQTVQKFACSLHCSVLLAVPFSKNLRPMSQQRVSTVRWSSLGQSGWAGNTNRYVAAARRKGWTKALLLPRSKNIWHRTFLRADDLQYTVHYRVRRIQTAMRHFWRVCFSSGTRAIYFTLLLLTEIEKGKKQIFFGQYPMSSKPMFLGATFPEKRRFAVAINTVQKEWLWCGWIKLTREERKIFFVAEVLILLLLRRQAVPSGSCVEMDEPPRALHSSAS